MALVDDAGRSAVRSELRGLILEVSESAIDPHDKLDLIKDLKDALSYTFDEKLGDAEVGKAFVNVVREILPRSAAAFKESEEFEAEWAAKRVNNKGEIVNPNDEAPEPRKPFGQVSEVPSTGTDKVAEGSSVTPNQIASGMADVTKNDAGVRNVGEEKTRVDGTSAQTFQAVQERDVAFQDVTPESGPENPADEKPVVANVKSGDSKAADEATEGAVANRDKDVEKATKSAERKNRN